MSPMGLELAQVSLNLGDFRLREISLAVDAGEILVILGPNGAGKSVLMELIAGFYQPDAGRIRVGEQEITHLAPEQRHVGFVFQNYALFPHMTVAQNIGYALHTQKHADRAVAKDRVAELMARFGLTDLRDRRPQGLSGGEKQRVALARALAMAPRLFLFDEPFAAVDERSREVLREEIRQMLRQTGVPAIFVTHDLTEARALADRLVIMRSGQIEQQGSVAEVLNRPANPFIADFTGLENILDGVVRVCAANGKAEIDVSGHLLHATSSLSLTPGEPVRVCIRPEHIEWPSEASVDAHPNTFLARIAAVRPWGPFHKIQFDQPLSLSAYTLQQRDGQPPLMPGDQVPLRLAAHHLHLIR